LNSIPTKTTDLILRMLRTGPRIASGLYDALERRGVSRAAAKTAVSRMLAAGKIFAFQLTLGNGNSVLSRTVPAADPHLLRRLYDADFGGRPGVKALVDCLRTSHPIVSLFAAAKLAVLDVGSPEKPRLEPTETVLKGLAELGAVTVNDNPEGTWIVNRNAIRQSGLAFGQIEPSGTAYAIREKVRFSLISSMTEWLRLNGFVSSQGTKLSTRETEIVSFGGIPFDLLGFSFAYGLAERVAESNRVIPRPVVGDCLVEECNRYYAESFVRRLSAASAKASKKLFPFVVARSFEADAFSFLANQGIPRWTHSQLLGKKTAEAIQNILEITQRIAAQHELTPEMFSEMFEGFDSFKGLFGDLKGKMFELLVAYYLQRRGLDIRLGWLIRPDWVSSDVQAEELESESADLNESDEEPANVTTSEQLDVDILATTSSEALFVECKGIKSGKEVDPAEINKHFRMRIPLGRRILLTERSRRVGTFVGVIVTTGSFDQETKTKVASGAYGNRADTRFELWDRDLFIAKLRQARETEVANLVEKYYP
jgi:hypothetical protein